MREIITLQVGQAGSRIGSKFWEDICGEHGVTPYGYIFEGTSDLQMERISTFYHEDEGRRFVPRAVLMDLDLNALTTIRRTRIGRMYRPDNFVFGRSGSESNWAKGHSSHRFQGGDLVVDAMDGIRKEAELCDHLQGFQICHSLGGGTGSGMTSGLLPHIKDLYSDKIVSSVTVFPTPLFSYSVIEPYNVILSLPQMVANTELTYCFENQALFDICRRNSPARPTYADLNQLISGVMSGVTTSYRFPVKSDIDMRKMALNLTPYPTLHFLVPGFAPILRLKSNNNVAGNISDLANEMFCSKNMLVNCNLSTSRYLTAASFFRGVSDNEMVSLSRDKKKAHSPHFIGWIPSDTQSIASEVPQNGLRMSATSIGNTTAFAQVLKRTKRQFEAMFTRKAHLHLYLDEGMEATEFLDAEETLTALIDEYLEHHKPSAGDAFVDDEEDDDYYGYEGQCFDHFNIEEEKGVDDPKCCCICC